MPRPDVPGERPRVEESAAIDARGARRLCHRHGAVGGRVDERLALDAALEQRKRRGVGETHERFGVQLARKDVRVFFKNLCLSESGRLVGYGDHFFRAVRERSDHGGRREQDVEHYDHLAGHTHRIQLLLSREDVELVVEINLYGQRAPSLPS